MHFNCPMIPYVQQTDLHDGEINVHLEKKNIIWGHIQPKGSTSFDDVDPSKHRFAKSIYDIFIKKNPLKYQEQYSIKKLDVGDQTLVISRPWQEVKKGILYTQALDIMS
jgi:hypothetical protein